MACATVRFIDGEERSFPLDGETVLAAAKKGGLNLISQCEVGTCLSCLATLVDGDARMTEGLVTPLSRDEIAGGQRLLCQSTASSDVRFDLGYPLTALAEHPPIRFQAKISRIDALAESVVQLELRVPKAVKFGFRAGQYCRVKVPGSDEWRSYSMASGEHERFRLSFLIRVLPRGLMSDYLRDGARVGDLLEIEGPLGGFVLVPEPRRHLLVAGGTGLAPMLSMLDRLRTLQPTPAITLVFGCVRERDLFLLEELEARKSFMPTLDVRVSLEEVGDRADVIRGNPVQAIPGDLPSTTVAYLCGPPGMVRAASQRLLEFGIEGADIRSEQFVAS